MSVGSIGSSGHGFQSLDCSSIEQGAFNSVSGQLALLMLDSQEQQKQIHEQEQAAAREDFTRELAKEVDSLRDQAEAALRSALVQGSLSIASAGFGIANVKANADLQANANAQADAAAASEGAADAAHCILPDKTTYAGVTAQALSNLAQPIGTYVANNDGAADAKAAQGQEEVAKWRLDAARDGAKDAKALQEKALDWVSSMLDRDAATMTAILSNKV